MRCACKACGTYMVQDEKGLLSGCVCPECKNACRDCMGSVEKPLSVDELRERYAMAAPAASQVKQPAPPPEWAEGWKGWTRKL